ncbi:LOW QUALITY PROTEIN: hypothetical protein RJ641_031519, partial [Dillenia turbinata]
GESQDDSDTTFVVGLNTLFQTCFGTRLPAVIGGSYTLCLLLCVLADQYSGIVNPQEVGLWKPCRLDHLFASVYMSLHSLDRFLMYIQRFAKVMQGCNYLASTFQIVVGFSGLWRNVTREKRSRGEGGVIPKSRAVRESQFIGVSGYSREGLPVYAIGVGQSSFDKA